LTDRLAATRGANLAVVAAFAATDVLFELAVRRKALVVPAVAWSMLADPLSVTAALEFLMT